MIMITLGAAKVLLGMITSCGNYGCFRAIENLRQVTGTVSLASVGMEDGQWLMAAFSRLKEFAVEEGITTLDTFDVARYFGGNMHIEIFRRHPSAGLGEYLGPYAGLVSHVLLPLDPDMVYRNAGFEVGFAGYEINYNPKEKGVPCYHLGVVVNIPLTKHQVEVIKAEQKASKPFIEALSKLKGPIVPPTEYYKALTCTLRKAATK